MNTHEPEIQEATILVVDDTVPNLNLLQAVLARHKHRVRFAENGRAALESALHDPPDLI